MKTILSLVGLYFATIVFGAISGFAATLLFVHATEIVVGGAGAAESLGQNLSLLLLWVAAAAIGASVLMVIYTIRYPDNGVARVLAYTALCLLSWLLVIPASLSLSSRLGHVNPLAPKDADPTAHYFRPHDGRLYYYTSVDEAAATADGVSFALGSLDSATDGSQLLEDAPLPRADIAPFSDVLIYHTLSRPEVVDLALPALYKSQQDALAAAREGPLSWLEFASWGLALYALIGVRRLFRWRLLNFTAVNVGFAAICAVNLYYSWGWDGAVFGLVSVPAWLMNCIVAAALSVAGILLAVFRPDPNMERPE